MVSIIYTRTRMNVYFIYDPHYSRVINVYRKEPELQQDRVNLQNKRDVFCEWLAVVKKFEKQCSA